MRGLAVTVLGCLLCCSCSVENVGTPKMNFSNVEVCYTHERETVRVVQRSANVKVISVSIGGVTQQIEPIAPSKTRRRAIEVVATAYCPCKRCCTRMTGRTFTGSNAWKPGVAVDPRVIPLGSVLEIPGYDRTVRAIADDTGGRIKGNIIDVRFQYHWQARQWGRQTLSVVLVE